MNIYGVIYLIKNNISNKYYIGQTTHKRGFNGRYWCSGKGIERVYKYHKFYKNKGQKYNSHLLRSIEKYGFEAFEVNECFDVAFSLEELNIKERAYIQLYDSFKNGYNDTEGGEGAKGYKHTDEAKLKMSKAKNELCKNAEYIERISKAHKGKSTWNKGKKFSEEAKLKMSKAHQNMSKETRQKMSDSAKLRGCNDPSRLKAVICLTTKEIFESATLASKYYNVSNHITQCCKGQRNYCGKLDDGTPLQWMYYDEYLKLNKNNATEVA